MRTPFIDGERFAQMRSGSVESGIAAAKALAEAYVGSPVEVLATHQDHMFVIAEGESSIRRLGMRVEDGEVKIISNRYREGYVSEESLDAYASSVLSDCVDDLIEGRGCNRLRTLASVVGPESRILFHEEFNAAMGVIGDSSYWSKVYESNSTLIRSFAYGDDESSREDDAAAIPSSRFSTMSLSEISGFGAELRESLEILLQMVQSISESLNSVDAERLSVDGCDSGKLLESLNNDCSALLNTGLKALEISRDTHLPELAELHDAVANMALPMMIMGRFVQSRSAEEV